MSKKIYSFIFILLNLLIFSSSQKLDKNTLKAAGCLTLVKKLKDKPSDQRVLTGLLLSCFIHVDEETADKLLQNQFYDKMGIEESEVLRLIDFNKIQSKYSQEQIEEFSKTLNTALEPLRDKGQGNRQGQEPDQYYNEDQNSNESNESIVNYFIKLFTSGDSLFLLFVLFGVFYFCLQKIRKWFGKNDKSSNNKTSNNNQKSNKTNKSNKRKKK